MKHLIQLLVALAISVSNVAHAQDRLLPVDHAATVPDFYRFRAQLQTSIAKRDLRAVKAAFNERVKLSFGSDDGIENFNTIWEPASPDSRLWETLARVLALGGTFGADGSFTAPYVNANWPHGKDPYTHMAAIGTGIRVRSSPRANATTIETLNYAVVELVQTLDDDAKWTQIRLSPTKTGFVDSRFLRSPIDYRINFAKLDGRWQVLYFLAGD